MGFFGSKKARGAVLTPESQAHAIALLAGRGFAKEVQAGHLPPPAYLWINRFANADPIEWEETTKALAEFRDRERYENSKGVLQVVLDRIATQGGDIGEILASEESVTLHFTVETITRAETLAAAHPDAMREQWGAGDEGGYWVEDMDSGVWLLCCEAQSRIRDVDRTLTMHALMGDDSALHRPDRVVRYAFLELERAFQECGPDTS